MMQIQVITKSFLMLLVIFLTVLSILGSVSSEIPNFMRKNCPGKNSYISGSAFEFYLNVTLFTQLLPNASTLRFSNVTNGFGEDQVYALYYCRGDIDAETCHGCVEAAIKRITDVCKFSKEGIVWFEECTLRYANRTIFSVEELEPHYLYPNTSGIVNDKDLGPYKEKFKSAMVDLIQQAAANANGTVPGFATTVVNLSSSEAVIRGLAQCTPDIVGPRCQRCLTAAFRQMDLWANTIVFLPSCLLRYDLSEKLLGPAPPPPPPPPSTPPPASQKALYIALIVVLPVVLIVLAVVGGTWIWKRCSRGNNPPEVERGAVVEVERVHGLPKYTFSQVEQMTKGFEKEIGKGGFGVVFRGRLLDGSREVAVKMLNEDEAPKQFSNEIDVFVKISHKNLVSLIGYCEEGTKLALIYEYMDKGDLRALLSENAATLSWTDRLKIAIDTAEGLHYLHRNCEVRIVHRDVKPANILLNQNLQAKVADFGLSKIFPEKDVTTLETRVIGTHGYKAPEYTATGLLNEKADVYSFGVVLLELITGKTPRLGFDLVKWFVNTFSEGDIEAVLDQRLKTNDKETMKVTDRRSVWGAAELARACIEEDGMLRPDMWEIIVSLKQCSDMEENKNSGNFQPGSTSKEIMSPVVSGAIAMGPEVR